MSDKNDNSDFDVTIFEKEGKTEFSKKLTFHKEKASKAFHELLGNIKTEATETQVASKILIKYLKEGNVSQEEEKELRTLINKN